MRRLYIAAPITSAEIAETLAMALHLYGHRIVSMWHTRVSSAVWSGPRRDPTDETERSALFASQLDDLDLADAVIVLAHTGTPRATFSEAGYAIARALPIAWVHGPNGEGRNIFDASPLVTRFDTKTTPMRLTVLAATLSEWLRGAGVRRALPTLSAEGP